MPASSKYREYAAFVAIFIAIGLVSGLLLYENWRRKVENHYAGEQALLAMSYRASLQTFSMVMDSYYFNVLSSDQVLALLTEAYDGDEEQRNLARGMLYRSLWRSYLRMRAQHIHRLHFHTPEGRSFLRFHDPGRYDDQLDVYRPLVRLANQERRPVRGFELSRSQPGFHFVFPLDDHKRRLGTVEMMVTIGSFLKTMRVIDERYEYAMIIRKEAVVSNLFPHWPRLFDVSVLSDDYLSEGAGLVDGAPPLPPEIESVNRLLAERRDVRDILAGGLEATVSVPFHDKWHIVTFFPVRDARGEQVAYLISYGQDQLLAQHGRESVAIWLGAMLGALVILALFARLRVRTVALDMERKHLMAVNEALAEGVYSQDQQGKITGFNSAAGKVLGFAKDEMLGRDAHELLHRRADGSEMPKEECAIHRRFDVGESYDGQEYFLTKDGRLLLVEIACRPILAGNRLMGSVCAFHDITARRAMEDALRQTEEKNRRLARALDQSPASVMIFDRQETIQYVNRRFTEISGYQAEEAIGRHPTFFRAEHFPEAITEDMWRTITAGGEWHGQLHSRRKNGDLYWEAASVSPVRDSQDKITHYIAVKEDISERLRMEQNVRDSEAFQRTLLESLPIGVAIVDQETRVIESANPYALKLFAASAQEVIGQRCHRFMCPNGEHCCPVSDLGQEVDNSDRELVRADGTRVPLLKTVRTITIGDEQKLLECFIDITERKRGEDALRQANRQLTEAIARAERLARDAEAASQAKSNFLASMSHEIRTPMNAVLGMTHLALRTELTARQRDYLDKVDRSARSLLDLLNEILDLSKVEAGKLELERIPFSLHEVLETMTTVIVSRIGAKDIELAVGIDHDVPPWLSGDPLRLRQVLINLAGNAAKFTEEGEIVVRARLSGQERDTVRIEFSIRDTGVGMDEEEQRAVFQPFTQANASTTRTFGGTGLGLSISQRLVALMGGTITVESAPGVGSTFRFTADFGVSAEPADETPISDAVRALKVLVVDDREAARFLLGEYLSILGVAYTAVDSAEAAIAAVKETAYSLALVDWRMPGMDGLQLTKAIAGQQTIPPPLVALVSAFGREEVRQQAINAGCVDFLAKPVDLRRLRELLERIATGGGGARFPDRSSSRPGDVDGMYFAGGLLLLAEDNLFNQQVATGLLENAGFQVMIAGDGAEAVRMAAERRFDGILMDIQMPEMDGYMATAKIRQLPGYEKTPIIAMTAYASVETMTKIRDAGMDEYLAKPIDLRLFFSVLARWFTVLTVGGKARPGTGAAAACQPATGQTPAPDGPLDEDEMAARLERLIPVLRGSRPKACAAALAALEAQRWPERLCREIEHMRQAVGGYNFTEAIRLAETLWRELKGENNA